MTAHKGKRGRRRPPPGDGAVWLFGLHAVRAALANPARRCRRLLITGDEALARIDAGDGAPAAERVDKAALAALLPSGAVHQGVALLTEPLPSKSLRQLGCTIARFSSLSSE